MLNPPQIWKTQEKSCSYILYKHFKKLSFSWHIWNRFIGLPRPRENRQSRCSFFQTEKTLGILSWLECVNPDLQVKSFNAKIYWQEQNRQVEDWRMDLFNFQGMACAGRQRTCSVVPSNHFGPIPGVEVGQSWKFRVGVGISIYLRSIHVMNYQ